jgi:hypothetical protein
VSEHQQKASSMVEHAMNPQTTGTRARRVQFRNISAAFAGLRAAFAHR